MIIYLIRHGETDYNREKLLMGQMNIPLNSLGLMQAEKVSNILETKKIDTIYTSDLIRATKTAEIIKGKKNIPLIHLQNFREHTLGNLDGMKWTPEWDELSKEEFEQIISKEGGEKLHIFEKRVWNSFIETIEKHKDTENIVIVTHGGVIRTVIMKILETSDIIFNNLKIDNCSITEIYHYHVNNIKRFRITTINANWFLN